MLCHLKQKEGISSLKEALMVGERGQKKGLTIGTTGIV
jgi:hypothetical protein